jgi:RNA polymerase sigma factor (sigma-70 family)
MDHKDEQKALDGLWDLARVGNSLAIENLINFIIFKGRAFLICFVRRSSGGQQTGYTTDVLQQTAIRIWKQANSGTLKVPKGNAFNTLGAFVANIAKESHRLHKILATRKSLGRIGLSAIENTLFLKAADGFDPGLQIPEVEEHLRDLDLLHQALAALGPKDRFIVEARLDGKTEKAIAEGMGISHEAVRQRYHRAVRAMAEHFKKLLQGSKPSI